MEYADRMENTYSRLQENIRRKLEERLKGESNQVDFKIIKDYQGESLYREQNVIACH